MAKTKSLKWRTYPPGGVPELGYTFPKPADWPKNLYWSTEPTYYTISHGGIPIATTRFLKNRRWHCLWHGQGSHFGVWALHGERWVRCGLLPHSATGVEYAGVRFARQVANSPRLPAFLTAYARATEILADDAPAAVLGPYTLKQNERGAGLFLSLTSRTPREDVNFGAWADRAEETGEFVQWQLEYMGSNAHQNFQCRGAEIGLPRLHSLRVPFTTAFHARVLPDPPFGTVQEADRWYFALKWIPSLEWKPQGW